MSKVGDNYSKDVVISVKNTDGGGTPVTGGLFWENATCDDFPHESESAYTNKSHRMEMLQKSHVKQREQNDN